MNIYWEVTIPKRKETPDPQNLIFWHLGRLFLNSKQLTNNEYFIAYVAMKIAVLLWRWNFLSTFSADSSSQLDVLGHDGYSFGVDGAQIGVLEEANQVSLRRFLQSHNSRRLESQVGLEVLGDLTDKTLEWQLANKKLGRLLVSSNFSESDRSWSVSVGFLHSASGRRALASGLGSQLLSGSLSTGRFACRLLCTSHFAW